MLRLKIETGLLIAFLLMYLFAVLVFASYGCFDPEPKVNYPLCDLDFWPHKIARVLGWR